MIQFYENSSNTEQALAYMERLRKIDPSNKRFNKQSMGSGVTEVQFEQLSNDPTITIDEKIKKMIPVLESEHFLTDTAFSNRIKNEIHQLAYENKNDLKLQALYGDALFLKKEYREASNQYIRAIELGKVPYSVWEHGIYSLIQSNRWISLEKYLNIALNYFPNQSYLYFALARALIDSNTSKVIDSKILQYRLLMAKNKNDEAKALIQSIEINNLSSAQIIEYSLAENCEVKQQNDLGQKLSEAWADDKLPLEYRLFSQSNTSFCKGDILNASKSMDRIVQSN
jgi:tetratricopeptide (TPR) repeat protein